MTLLSRYGYCSVELIDFDYYKDGGTSCVRYKANNKNIECCISHRSLEEYGKVFIGGYPGSKDSKIISGPELKSIYDDIEMIMNSSDYKKYSNFGQFRMRVLMVVNRNEYRKARSYRLLKPFKQDMYNKMNEAKSK
jgi:hypothetical protein